MTTTNPLLSLIGPSSEPVTLGRAERMYMTVGAALGGVACVAAWGALAGAATHQSMKDMLVAPVVLVASSLSALPLGVFLGKLFGRAMRASDMFLAHATATFAGAAALLFAAPLVALYQHSSSLIGSLVGPASTVFGLAVGAFVFLRTLGKLAQTVEARRSFIVPTIAVLVLQALSMMQLASVLPPLFGHRTTLGHGIDAISQPHEAAPSEVQ